ncbi:hypothetical protein PSHT_09071 [Puccinia striiformis]|uniref:Uncharacterized protein n=1 Tax=Puccinia striiformis TaxID=27350 RepID=A0A2S4VJK1_9BASI|nr:hypothetical protein PSHT_09071 [Puccinia striiformis]
MPFATMTKVFIAVVMLSVSTVTAAPAGGAYNYYPNGAPNSVPSGALNNLPPAPQGAAYTYNRAQAVPQYDYSGFSGFQPDGSNYNPVPATSQRNLLGGLLGNDVRVEQGSSANKGVLGLGLGGQHGDPVGANLRVLNGGQDAAGSPVEAGSGGGLVNSLTDVSTLNFQTQFNSVTRYHAYQPYVSPQLL